jgi:hypothetical protein
MFHVKYERYLTAEIAEIAEKGATITLIHTKCMIKMMESRKYSASSACSAVKFLAIL